MALIAQLIAQHVWTRSHPKGCGTVVLGWYQASWIRFQSLGKNSANGAANTAFK